MQSLTKYLRNLQIFAEMPQTNLLLRVKEFLNYRVHRQENKIPKMCFYQTEGTIKCKESSIFGDRVFKKAITILFQDFGYKKKKKCKNKKKV